MSFSHNNLQIKNNYFSKLLFCFLAIFPIIQSFNAQQFCNTTGNLVIFSNYDGGILTINVDQNIPNLKIGICTYEPIQVNFVGPFVGNITQVLYGGFNSNQNNNNCAQGNFTTSITGVPAGIVSINPPLDPPAVGYTPTHGFGSASHQMVAAVGACDTMTPTGGGNTPDEIVYYFQDQMGGSLYFHHTTYGCYLNSTLNISGGGTCCIEPSIPLPPPPPTGVCNVNGNVMLYSNYNGGVLNINVDQNIPNLKIGISTYEACAINITGAFASNVTEVIYAGYNASNNAGCGPNIPTTIITGVSPSIVTNYSYSNGTGAFANYLGDVLGGVNFVNCIIGSNGACSTTNSGGGNSVQQLVQFFLAEFGAGSVLFAHESEGGCFLSSTTYNVSAGGNCCVSAPTNPPNPIYAGGDNYNFIVPTTYSLCGGPLVLNLSNYPVLFQPTTYTGYVWSNGVTGPIITINTPGTYSFTVTDYCHTNPDFLTDTIVVSACCVTPLPDPTFTLIQPTCLASGNSITFTTPIGPDYEYSIDGGITFQSNPVFTNATAGVHVLVCKNIVTLCISGNTVTTTINAPLVVPIVQIQNFTNPSCAGQTNGTANATVTNGFSPILYSWSNGFNGSNAINLAAGTYTVTATNSQTCSASATVTITNPSPIVLTETVTNTDCGETDNGTILVVSSGGSNAGYTYSWLPFDDITNSLNTLPVGTYTVVVLDQNGCSATETYVVESTGTLSINVTPSIVEAVVGSSVEFLATGATDFTWSPSLGLSCADCPNPTAIVAENIVYSVTGTLENGCEGSTTVSINIPEICNDIFVPTVFTPDANGPAENNLICVLGSCISYFDLVIYDRWGEIVFMSISQNNCWDGKIKGNEAQAGQYAYKLTVTKSDGKKMEEKGNITLVR
jgi:gliding motility-associated-like protein